MHNAIETCRPACERAATRGLEPFGEDPPTALGEDAVEPARADYHHNMLSLGRTIGQRSLVAAAEVGRYGPADRTGGGHAEAFRDNQQLVGRDLNVLDTELAGSKRASMTHYDDPMAVHRPRSTQIPSGLS